MHELSLIESVVREALAVSSGHENRRVVRVRLRIGALCQVVPESLGFAFEALTSGTPMEGAVLEWEVVPVRVRCEGCGEVFCPGNLYWVCTRCGESGCTAVEGADLFLDSVDLLDGDGNEN